MKSTKRATWRGRPWGWWVLLSAAVACAILYTVMLQRHWLFEPLPLEGRPYHAIVLLNAAGLTFLLAASLLFVRVRKREDNGECSRQAITAMRDAVVVTDAQDRIVEWNPAAERLLPCAIPAAASRVCSALRGM